VKFVALLSEESSDFPWSCEVTPSDFMQDKPVAHHIVSIKVRAHEYIYNVLSDMEL